MTWDLKRTDTISARIEAKRRNGAMAVLEESTLHRDQSPELQEARAWATKALMKCLDKDGPGAEEAYRRMKPQTRTLIRRVCGVKGIKLPLDAGP